MQRLTYIVKARIRPITELASASRGVSYISQLSLVLIVPIGTVRQSWTRRLITYLDGLLPADDEIGDPSQY